ncbi:hypothetical protein [Pseudomonas sp. B22129]|uniref:hypothetical protein n=1 Tax=Pseudomonas sp. B22129 TaxID=3235111 RepID=UPI003783C977
MSNGQNQAFRVNPEKYLTDNVLMTGFLTRLAPVPVFLSEGGIFSFDLVRAGSTWSFRKEPIRIENAPALEMVGGESPISARWLPQGGNIIMPLRPRPMGVPDGLMFTAELSGCTLVIDATPLGLKVYHVQPGRLAQEYTNVRAAGDVQRLIITDVFYDSGNFNANVLMYNNDGQWRVALQRWTGAYIGQLAGPYIDRYKMHDVMFLDV